VRGGASRSGGLRLLFDVLSLARCPSLFLSITKLSSLSDFLIEEKIMTSDTILIGLTIQS
jgi:hypothetical protein